MFIDKFFCFVCLCVVIMLCWFVWNWVVLWCGWGDDWYCWVLFWWLIVVWIGVWWLFCWLCLCCCVVGLFVGWWSVWLIWFVFLWLIWFCVVYWCCCLCSVLLWDRLVNVFVWYGLVCWLFGVVVFENVWLVCWIVCVFLCIWLLCDWVCWVCWLFLCIVGKLCNW